MAYCAPKQLAATLPQVVPALTEHALTASHPRVKEGANAALASVGAVIKNPEIARLVPKHPGRVPGTEAWKKRLVVPQDVLTQFTSQPGQAGAVPGAGTSTSKAKGKAKGRKGRK